MKVFGSSENAKEQEADPRQQVGHKLTIREGSGAN